MSGESVYGTVPTSGDPSTADATFSISYVDTPFDEFLFATGDQTKWLVASRDAVLGGYYANAQRTITLSSTSSQSYTAAWYNRAGALEDPWISLSNHGSAISAGEILYGENNFAGTHASAVLPVNNGANVYIRGSSRRKLHETHKRQPTPQLSLPASWDCKVGACRTSDGSQVQG